MYAIPSVLRIALSELLAVSGINKCVTRWCGVISLVCSARLVLSDWVVISVVLKIGVFTVGFELVMIKV